MHGFKSNKSERSLREQIVGELHGNDLGGYFGRAGNLWQWWLNINFGKDAMECREVRVKGA